MIGAAVGFCSFTGYLMPAHIHYDSESSWIKANLLRAAAARKNQIVYFPGSGVFAAGEEDELVRPPEKAERRGLRRRRRGRTTFVLHSHTGKCGRMLRLLCAACVKNIHQHAAGKKAGSICHK